jgi:hypothetical protein
VGIKSKERRPKAMKKEYNVWTYIGYNVEADSEEEAIQIAQENVEQDWLDWQVEEMD